MELFSLRTRAAFSLGSSVRTGRSAVTKVAASALVPAILLSGTPAVAASNTLTITTLDRAGKKIAVTTTVVNLATNESRSVRSGQVKKLPKGTYAVLASIDTGLVSTLGASIVTVSGTTKTTLDARKGRKVTLGLSPAPADASLETQTIAQICTVSKSAVERVEAWDFANELYVIPNSSKKLAFAAMRTWTDHSGETDRHAVMYSTTTIPSTPSRTFSRSALATVNVETRRGPSGSVSSSLAVQPIDRPCGSSMYGSLLSFDRPYRTKVFLSPGKWVVRAESYAGTKDGSTWNIGGFYAPRQVAAGTSYNLRFFRAAWGPAAVLPVLHNGRISYSLNNMFADPGFPRQSVEGGDKATATLTFRGKTVKTVKDRGWEPEEKVLNYTVKQSGWYTLTNTASRYYPEITFPSGMLSPRTSVTFRFKAKPRTWVAAPVYAVTMRPVGLNLYNQAKPGSTTNVELKLSRPKGDPDIKLGKNPPVKTVSAKASFDGGRTWRSVQVKKIAGTWTALVGNPQSGAVSLRVRVTDTTGGYTDVTIIRAYAIG
ncbi:hypothetical protein ACNAW0_26555 [Micromonospora sp. SL1-18]|uniref:hypothetical protein n=1 Tax=Micromonospora sp. SL1-18 TaxID=3399128 RepID=UPI003A4DD4C5